MKRPMRPPGGASPPEPAEGPAEANVALREALEEIARKGRAIMNGQRLVGGPKAAAFDLVSVAERALAEAGE